MATLSGFNAMGLPVPTERLSEGLAAIREMIPGIPTEQAMSVVGKMAAQLERDEPYEALRSAEGVLDTTGRYRLMATLLTDPPQRG